MADTQLARLVAGVFDRFRRPPPAVGWDCFSAALAEQDPTSLSRPPSHALSRIGLYQFKLCWPPLFALDPDMHVLSNKVGAAATLAKKVKRYAKKIRDHEKNVLENPNAADPPCPIPFLYRPPAIHSAAEKWERLVPRQLPVVSRRAPRCRQP